MQGPSKAHAASDGNAIARPDGASGFVPSAVRREDTRHERSLFARTPAGEAEQSARLLPLSASARRLLMLIDGRRPLALLANFVRAGEIERLLDELLQHSLVVQCGSVDPPDEASERARQRRELASLQAAKQRLQSLFERELGIEGLVMDARIADCVSMQVMRRVARDLIDQITERHGAARASRLLASLRQVFVVEDS